MPSNAEHIPRIGKKIFFPEMKYFRRTENYFLLLKTEINFRCVLLFKYGYDRYVDIFMYDCCAYLLSW